MRYVEELDNAFIERDSNVQSNISFVSLMDGG